MKLFIGHESALEYWRQHDLDERPRETQAVPGHGYSPSVEDIMMLKELGIRACPRHFMESQKRHVESKYEIAHIDSHMLRRSYMAVNEVVAVSSPELCLFQLASKLSVVQLAATVCELCGTYSKGTGRTFKPRSSIEALRALGDRLQHERGFRKFSKAVNYAVEGSASPAETQLMLRLCLPTSLGGYGLPLPKFNDPIAGTRFRCDLYWPESKLALEYDSDQFHSGKAKINKDSMRRSELESTGVHVISVTHGQLKNICEFDKVANAAARRLGVRLRIVRKDRWQERQALKKELSRE